jgi:hypothetical protein
MLAQKLIGSGFLPTDSPGEGKKKSLPAVCARFSSIKNVSGLFLCGLKN